MTNRDRFRGCLLGLACGDAVGTAVEFKPRGTFSPVTDMIGGGPFHLQPGEWTDDTSMALCLATSLVEKDEFDPKDQMERYRRWWTEGYLSSNGTCFDIGGTVSSALREFELTGNPYSGSRHPRSAGNGSIMRLAPVPMFYFPDVEEVIRFSGTSSRTTHGTAECVDACQLFGSIVFSALCGKTKDEILLSHAFSGAEGDSLSAKVRDIARGTYAQKAEEQIKGSGYVVQSLEAALWCFLHTDDFRDAVLRAANLGDDADTTAAVCGQIAGAHYGQAGIPEAWLNKLVMRDKIIRLADRLEAGKQVT